MNHTTEIHDKDLMEKMQSHRAPLLKVAVFVLTAWAAGAVAAGQNSAQEPPTSKEKGIINSPYEEPHEQWGNHIVVNCDAGQSLNNAIAKLNKQIPNTVTVQGTCTEYITITGFENLTIKSTSGATLVQPSVVPTIFVTLLRINASRSVTIDGLNFTSDASKPPAIGIGAGSNDVRLRNLNIVGGSVGIFALDTSDVSIARVNVKNSGLAYVFAVDGSTCMSRIAYLRSRAAQGGTKASAPRTRQFMCVEPRFGTCRSALMPRSAAQSASSTSTRTIRLAV